MDRVCNFSLQILNVALQLLTSSFAQRLQSPDTALQPLAMLDFIFDIRWVDLDLDLEIEIDLDLDLELDLDLKLDLDLDTMSRISLAIGILPNASSISSTVAAFPHTLGQRVSSRSA